MKVSSRRGEYRVSTAKSPLTGQKAAVLVSSATFATDRPAVGLPATVNRGCECSQLAPTLLPGFGRTRKPRPGSGNCGEGTWASTMRSTTMKAEKILYPTDFSEAGQHALALATSLARDSGATLIIAHVEEPPTAYGGGEMYYGVDEVDHEELRKSLAEIVPTDPAVPCV